MFFSINGMIFTPPLGPPVTAVHFSYIPIKV